MGNTEMSRVRRGDSESEFQTNKEVPGNNRAAYEREYEITLASSSSRWLPSKTQSNTLLTLRTLSFAVRKHP